MLKGLTIVTHDNSYLTTSLYRMIKILTVKTAKVKITEIANSIVQDETAYDLIAISSGSTLFAP